MSNIHLMGKPLHNVTIAPLAPEYQSKLGLKLAIESTKNNGIDEIFFEKDNQFHVLYSDSLELSGYDGIASLSLDGKPVKTLKVNNELNSGKEKTTQITNRALHAGVENGVGGALGGVAVMLVRLGTAPLGAKGKAVGLGLGALAGFVSGFAWGAGSKVVGELKMIKQQDMQSIQDIIAQPQN